MCVCVCVIFKYKIDKNKNTIKTHDPEFCVADLRVSYYSTHSCIFEV